MGGIPIKRLLAFGAIVFAAALFAIWIGANLWRSYHFQEGRSVFNRGDYEVAESLFKRSLVLWLKDPEGHFYLGKIALGRPNQNPEPGEIFYPQADYATAVGHYKQSLSDNLKGLNPTFYEQALNDIGFSLWMLKRFHEADEYFIRYIGEFPEKSFTARYLLAYDHFSIFNKPKEALDILKPAPTLATLDIHRINLYKIHVLLAQLYVYFDDYTSAAEHAGLAIKSESPVGSEAIKIAHMMLASAYIKNGDFAAAEREISEANKSSETPEAYNCSLANAYSTAGYHTKAVDIAQKTSRAGTERRYSVCLNALADSLFALGEKKEAAKFYREYLSTTENLPYEDIFTIRRREKAAEMLQRITEN